MLVAVQDRGGENCEDGSSLKQGRSALIKARPSRHFSNRCFNGR